MSFCEESSLHRNPGRGEARQTLCRGESPFEYESFTARG